MKYRVALTLLAMPLLAANLYAASSLFVNMEPLLKDAGQDAREVAEAMGKQAPSKAASPCVTKEQAQDPSFPKERPYEASKPGPDGWTNINLEVRLVVGGPAVYAESLLEKYNVAPLLSPGTRLTIGSAAKGCPNGVIVRSAPEGGMINQSAGPSGKIWFTLNFLNRPKHGLDGFRFERPEIYAEGENGVWYPRWTAEIFYVMKNEIDAGDLTHLRFAEDGTPYSDDPRKVQVYSHIQGEGTIRHFDTDSDVPRYVLNTDANPNKIPGKIIAIKFESNNYSQAAWSSVTLYRMGIR